MRDLFLWSYKLASTRSFAWEDGMVIPLADNINHADEYVSYKSKPYSYLKEHINGQSRIDYSDFSGRVGESDYRPMNGRTLLNRLEKYIRSCNSIEHVLNSESLWDLENLIND